MFRLLIASMPHNPFPKQSAHSAEDSEDRPRKQVRQWCADKICLMRHSKPYIDKASDFLCGLAA
jgi:hypothetical protein